MKRVIDIATAPLPEAASYLDTPKPRKGTKDAEKIEAQIADKLASRLEMAATDWDLCRITAVGWLLHGEPESVDNTVRLCQNEHEEGDALVEVAAWLANTDAKAVTFGGMSFDLPILQRRAKYLGVPFPILNLDRFRSPHPDLMLLLSGGDKDKYRSLKFYCRRLGWDDLCKPLEGAREAQVFQTGEWALLKDSVLHDLWATARLASWAKAW